MFSWLQRLRQRLASPHRPRVVLVGPFAMHCTAVVEPVREFMAGVWGPLVMRRAHVPLWGWRVSSRPTSQPSVCALPTAWVTRVWQAHQLHPLVARSTTPVPRLAGIEVVGCAKQSVGVLGVQGTPRHPAVWCWSSSRDRSAVQRCLPPSTAFRDRDYRPEWKAVSSSAGRWWDLVQRVRSRSTVEQVLACDEPLEVLLAAYDLRTITPDISSVYETFEQSRAVADFEPRCGRRYSRSSLQDVVLNEADRVVAEHAAGPTREVEDSRTGVLLRRLQRLLGLRRHEGEAWAELVTQAEQRIGKMPDLDGGNPIWRDWQLRLRRFVARHPGREVRYPIQTWDWHDESGRRRPWCWVDVDFLGLIVRAIAWARTCPPADAPHPNDLHPGLAAWALGVSIAAADEVESEDGMVPLRERPMERILQRGRTRVSWIVRLPHIEGTEWWCGQTEARRVESEDLDVHLWSDPQNDLDPLVLRAADGAEHPGSREWRVIIPTVGRWIRGMHQRLDPGSGGLRDSLATVPLGESWWLGPGEPPMAPSGRAWGGPVCTVIGEFGPTRWQGRRLASQATRPCLRIDAVAATDVVEGPVYFFQDPVDGRPPWLVLEGPIIEAVEVVIESHAQSVKLWLTPDKPRLNLRSIVGKQGPLWVHLVCKAADVAETRICFVDHRRWCEVEASAEGTHWFSGWPEGWEQRSDAGDWVVGPGRVRLPLAVDTKTIQLRTVGSSGPTIFLEVTNPTERVVLDHASREGQRRAAPFTARCARRTEYLSWQELTENPRWRVELHSARLDAVALMGPGGQAVRGRWREAAREYWLGGVIDRSVRECRALVAFDLVDDAETRTLWRLESRNCHFAAAGSCHHSIQGFGHAAVTGINVPTAFADSPESSNSRLTIHWHGKQNEVQAARVPKVASAAVVSRFHSAPASVGALWSARLTLDGMPIRNVGDSDLGSAARELWAYSWANRSQDLQSPSAVRDWTCELRAVVETAGAAFLTTLPPGWHRAWCSPHPLVDAIVSQCKVQQLLEAFEAESWLDGLAAAATGRTDMPTPLGGPCGPWGVACERWMRDRRAWMQARSWVRELVVPICSPPGGLQPYVGLLGRHDGAVMRSRIRELARLELLLHAKDQRAQIVLRALSGAPETAALLALPLWADQSTALVDSGVRSLSGLPEQVAALGFLQIVLAILGAASPAAMSQG